MTPLLMKAVIAITLALIFYAIGVWSEHRAKVLRPVHLAFFWLGLIMDTAGTYMMSQIAGASGGGTAGSGLLSAGVPQIQHRGVGHLARAVHIGHVTGHEIKEDEE